MSQPSTDNELQIARRRLGVARDACPHWDMADEPPGTFRPRSIGVSERSRASMVAPSVDSVVVDGLDPAVSAAALAIALARERQRREAMRPADKPLKPWPRRPAVCPRCLGQTPGRRAPGPHAGPFKDLCAVCRQPTAR